VPPPAVYPELEGFTLSLEGYVISLLSSAVPAG
jgi:hypothetical protein